MALDVFISYSTKDQKIVEDISQYLEQNGIRCFVAYRDIPKSVVWAKAITEAIEKCIMMVVVFSEHANSSDQMDREIELCVEEKKPILTFRIQDKNFAGAKKYYLKNINWIDAFPNPEKCFGELLKSVKILLPQRTMDDSSAISPAKEKSAANFTEPQSGIEMEYVEGGTFKMGATREQGSDYYDDEKPAHQVTVSSFHISKYQVTQAQWKAVMGNNPSNFKGDNLPVEQVSWIEVQEFINKLNAQTGKQYRLPTEAEWEFAARGGIKSKGYKYSGSDTVDSVAWYSGNSEGKTHDVGKKQANELNLHDMSGNVWEWCQDWYSEKYYEKSPPSNPKGPDTGFGRVVRGGGWYYSARSVRVSNRDRSAPTYRNNDIGFRLASSSK